MDALQEQPSTPNQPSFAYGFGSESTQIVRDYSEGLAHGFLNDLADGRAGSHPQNEDELIKAFLAYVAKAANP